MGQVDTAPYLKDKNWRKNKPSPLIWYLYCAMSYTALRNVCIYNLCEKKLQKKKLKESEQQYYDFFAGIHAYQNININVRALAKNKDRLVFQRGEIKIYQRGNGKDKPILLVPSMINRFYIFDLFSDQSFITYLNRQGFNCFYIDWGKPNLLEQNDDIEAYLHHIVTFIAEQKRRFSLIGYCMGGIMTLLLALHPQIRLKIKDIICFATPWRFHEYGPMFLPQIPITAMIAPELLQCMFLNISPFQVFDKFVAFSHMKDPEKVYKFVLLEDWLNDGVSLPIKVSQTCFYEWYQKNALYTQNFTMWGQRVNLQNIQMPSLLIHSKEDRIVPYHAAKVLEDLIPNNQTIITDFGHIGMMTSQKAPLDLWPKIVDWLHK